MIQPKPYLLAAAITSLFAATATGQRLATYDPASLSITAPSMRHSYYFGLRYV